MEKKIKMLVSARDREMHRIISPQEILDLGEARNRAAVRKGLAVWVDSTEFLQAKRELEKEEGEPKKPAATIKGKKIDSK